MKKITRIAYNSADWRKPTGEASRHESTGSYNQMFGFGHEDWLFRAEWLIDGWRYAFIQGVNKSHAKLIKAGTPVDLTLFTILPDKRRCIVAIINSVECLDDQQAEDALVRFKELGWYGTMLKEIDGVGGNRSALDDTKFAKHILNVRYRLENVQPPPSDPYFSLSDPIVYRSRYQLYDYDRSFPSSSIAKKLGRAGSETPPSAEPFERRASSLVLCTPEHARMQVKLKAELHVEYPKAEILCEQDFIDVSVRTDDELILFEIKSDIEPRSVIRQALGQILEYAYHPNRSHVLPVQMVIVGRRPLAPADVTYLDKLKSKFFLPLNYRVVAL